MITVVVLLVALAFVLAVILAAIASSVTMPEREEWRVDYADGQRTRRLCRTEAESVYAVFRDSKNNPAVSLYRDPPPREGRA